MIVLIIYFLIVLAVAAFVCYLIWLALRPFGMVRQIVIPIFLAVAIGLFPIPMHGTFTFMGAVAIDGIEEWLEERAEVKVVEQERKVAAKDALRLERPVDIIKKEGLRNGWSSVTVEGDRMAFLDHSSGLIWLDENAPSSQNPDKLKNVCRAIGPFALPLETEMYFFYRNHGADVMPFASARYPSLLRDDAIGMDMLKWRIFRHSSNQSPTTSATMIRCVGRTSDVPSEGLLNTRISLADWNEFQLAPIR